MYITEPLITYMLKQQVFSSVSHYHQHQDNNFEFQNNVIIIIITITAVIIKLEILACTRSSLANLLLAKIYILASMFVCRFVTCQNLQFLASMFVCRFVCLSVCLLVCQFCQA